MLHRDRQRREWYPPASHFFDAAEHWKLYSPVFSLDVKIGNLLGGGQLGAPQDCNKTIQGRERKLLT